MRQHIGVAAQDATLDGLLTGRQNLHLIGELSRMSRADSRTRATELLERFELTFAADRVAKGYSGGMRRRLDLAASLMTRPPVLFLDEPTTGLDPSSRLRMWDIIRELVAEGVTVLLTTQYLDEADTLADHIVVIDHGKVIAQGTPAGAQGGQQGRPLEVTLAERAPRRGLRPATAGPRAGAGGRGRTACSRPRSTTRRDWPPPWSGRSTGPACWSTTSRCGSPRSMTSSSPSPAVRPRSLRHPFCEGAPA